MAQITDADIDWIEQWAERQRGFVALAAALRGIGSLEQATTERKAALDAAIKEHEAAVASVTTAAGELADLKAKHEAAVRAQAAELLASAETAKADAARIIDSAQERAKETTKAAEADALRTRAALASELDGLNAKLVAGRMELASMQQAAALAKAEHDDTLVAIEAMKTAARGILG